MEWLCFKQHIYFSLRNRRYLTIAVTQYLYSFYNWKHAKNLRYTFCTLQLIDDILDGDRQCEIEPLDYLEQLKTAIQKKEFNSSDLHQMTKFFLLRTEQFGPMIHEAKVAFNELIDIMMADRKRVLAKRIFTKEELRHHHDTTFRYSLDIVLIALESPLRAAHLPEILDIFAWCSTVRDLQEDLEKDLINVPLEITSKIEHFPSLKVDQKIKHPLVQSWLVDETRKAERLFLICDEKMKELRPIHGSFIFGLFLKSMKKYTRVIHA
ncbi:MAG: hypothetical protein ACXVCE_04310 [Bacteriovorax sp.]